MHTCLTHTCVHATRTLYPLRGSLHTRDDVTLGAVAWITRWPESSSGPSIANYRPRGFASFRDRFAPFSLPSRPAAHQTEKSCAVQEEKAPGSHPLPGNGRRFSFRRSFPGGINDVSCRYSHDRFLETYLLSRSSIFD